MAKTIANVLTGVSTLSVRDMDSLAEWTKEQQMNGLYSAHLKKNGTGTVGSTHVQFNPTTHTVTFQDFVDDMDAPGTGFQFWERTSGTALNWAQFEMRFEQVGGDGWFELTCIPHQHQIYNANDWGALAYIIIDATPCGFGGNTPDGSSVFEWAANTIAAATAAAALSVESEFEDEEVGSGAGVYAYVLARVRVELWEIDEREVWIGDVDIDGHEYVMEPGGATPGLVLSSPNIEIGYTEDGVIMTYTATTAPIRVEEETFAIEEPLSEEDVEITCNMAEASMFNMDKAMSGSVLLTNVISLGGGVNKGLNITLEGLTPSGFKRTIYVPKAVATGAVAMPYRKAEKTVVPVT
ncbi:unnamed protein product, partial [marine sediment metagenome]